MVALVNIEEVRKGLRIGIHANGKWYARIAAYDPSTKKDNTRDVSLKLKFEEGSPTNKNEAIEQARKIADKVGERIGKTSNPFKEYLVADLAKEWLKVIQFCTGENEKLAAKNKPMKYEVFGYGSKGYWTQPRFDLAVTMNNHLLDFFETLPHQEITKIKSEHLDRFATWCGRFDWSGSYVTRMITQIRMIWKFAIDEKELPLDKPTPRRPQFDNKDSSRRKLQENEYQMMLDYAEDKYKNPRKAAHFVDKYLQFYCWILLIGHSGIRPPTTLKNAIRYSQIVRPRAKAGEPEFIFIDRQEKNTEPYKAMVLPEAYEAFDLLEDLYRRRGLWKPEFLFAHTTHREASDWTPEQKIGAPILSFRTQWNTMINNLNLGTKEKAQKYRLSPYTMRGRFHTYLFDNHPEIRMESIAEITGTSVRMLEQSYVDVKTEKTARDIASQIPNFPTKKPRTQKKTLKIVK